MKDARKTDAVSYLKFTANSLHMNTFSLKWRSQSFPCMHVRLNSVASESDPPELPQHDFFKHQTFSCVEKQS